MSSPSLAIANGEPAINTRVRIPPPVVLILLTLLTRVPLHSRTLYSWDSVNFAFALHKFDMAAGQPQAPGYFCYVLLGRLANALMGSPESGYVALSILGSALAAWALYDLGRRVWNPRVGWFASLLLLSSPLYWFYGEVALPHALDALMVIVAADLSWRVWQGEQRLAPLLALWLALAGGLRQQTLVFMLPLAVVAGWRLPWRTILLSAALLAVGTLAWLVPLAHLSGGYARYFGYLRTYSEYFDRPTSVFLGAGWGGLRQNLDRLVRYTLWALAFGLVPILLGLGTLRRTQETPWRRNPRVWLLALWAAPSLLFYVFVHMGQQGLIFVYLPVCFLMAARAGDALARQWAGGTAVMAACVVANALAYVAAPAYLLPGQRLKVYSQATVRAHDRLLESVAVAVQADLPPNAALLTNEWRFAEYYQPHVPLVAFDTITTDESGESTLAGAPPLPSLDSVTALAWYEPALDARNKNPARTTMMSDHDGVRLRVLHRAPNEHFWVTSSGFGVAPN